MTRVRSLTCTSSFAVLIPGSVAADSPTSCTYITVQIPSVLHLATLSGVLACLMRHFRASLASLPLLAQPLGSLPLGTWSPDAVAAHSELLPDSKDRRQWKKLQVRVQSVWLGCCS